MILAVSSFFLNAWLFRFVPVPLCPPFVLSHTSLMQLPLLLRVLQVVGGFWLALIIPLFPSQTCICCLIWLHVCRIPSSLSSLFLQRAILLASPRSELQLSSQQAAFILTFPPFLTSTNTLIRTAFLTLLSTFVLLLVLCWSEANLEEPPF